MRLRAYHKPTGQLSEPFDLVDGLTTCTDLEGEDFVCIKASCGYEPQRLLNGTRRRALFWSLRDCVLLLSTGLEDQDGVEIFAGDKFEFRWSLDTLVTGEVVYSAGCWVVQGVCIAESNMAFLLRFVYANGRVVGNVWEN